MPTPFDEGPPDGTDLGSDLLDGSILDAAFSQMDAAARERVMQILQYVQGQTDRIRSGTGRGSTSGGTTATPGTAAFGRVDNNTATRGSGGINSADLNAIVELVRALGGAAGNVKQFSSELNAAAANVKNFSAGTKNQITREERVSGITNAGIYQQRTGVVTSLRQSEIQATMMGLNKAPLAYGRAPHRQAAHEFGRIAQQGMNPDQINSLMGSLGRSFDFLGARAKVLDDVTSAMFTRGKLDQMVNAGAFNSIPQPQRMSLISNARTGLEQRTARHMADVSGLTKSSLERYSAAYQESYKSLGHSRGISLDAGSIGGGYRSSPTAMGSYAQDLIRQVQTATQVSSTKGATGAVVQDLSRYRGALGAGVIQRVQSNPELLKTLDQVNAKFRTTASSGDTFSKKLEDVQKQFSSSRMLQRKVAEMDPSDPRFATANTAAIASSERAMQAMDEIMAGMDRRTLRKAGMNDAVSLTDTIKSLKTGESILGGERGLSTTQKFKSGTVEPMTQTMGKFVEMNAMQLQWALMFGFSSPIFQGLTQVPMESTYQTMGPVHQALGSLTGMQSFQQEFTGFAQTAPAVMNDMTSRVNTMTSLLGSSMYAQQAVGKALETARTKPIQFPEAMEVLTAMSIYPGTRSQATNSEFQEKMFDATQLLTMLAPEQGTSGAVFAIRELLAGQFRSLERRFNISPEIIAGYAGKSYEEFKGESGADMIRTLNLGLSNMMGGQEVLLKKGAQFDVQIKNIGDTLTSSIIEPMVTNIRSEYAGLLQQNMTPGPGGSRIEGSNLEKILPEAQVKLFQNAALERAAVDVGVKYDPSKNLAQYLDQLKGEPGRQEQFQESYGRNVQSLVQGSYGTTQGMLALLTTAFNSALSPIMEGFGISGGIAGLVERFGGRTLEGMSSFRGRMSAIDRGEVETPEGRQKAKSDAVVRYIKTFMKDLEDSVNDAMDGLATGPGSRAIKSVRDSLGKIGMRLFEPISQAIMVQSGKAALGMPGQLFGGVIQNTAQGGLDFLSGKGGNIGVSDIGSTIGGAGTWLQIGKIFNQQAKWYEATPKIAGFAMMQRSFEKYGALRRLQERTGQADYSDLAMPVGLTAAMMFGPQLGRGLYGMGRDAYRDSSSAIARKMASRTAQRGMNRLVYDLDETGLYVGREPKNLRERFGLRTPGKWARRAGIGAGVAALGLSAYERYQSVQRSGGAPNAWDIGSILSGGAGVLGGTAVGMAVGGPVGALVGAGIGLSGLMGQQFLGQKGDEQRQAEALKFFRERAESTKIRPLELAVTETKTKAAKDVEGINETYGLVKNQVVSPEEYDAIKQYTQASYSLPARRMLDTYESSVGLIRKQLSGRSDVSASKLSLLMPQNDSDLRKEWQRSDLGQMVASLATEPGKYFEYDKKTGKVGEMKAGTTDAFVQAIGKFVDAIGQFTDIKMKPDSYKALQNLFSEGELRKRAQQGADYRRADVDVFKAIQAPIYGKALDRALYPIKAEPIPDATIATRTEYEQNVAKVVGTVNQMFGDQFTRSRSAITLGVASGAITAEEWTASEKKKGGLYARLLRTGAADVGTMTKNFPDMMSSLLMSGRSMDDIGRLIRPSMKRNMSTDEFEKQIVELEKATSSGNTGLAKKLLDDMAGKTKEGQGQSLEQAKNQEADASKTASIGLDSVASSAIIAAEALNMISKGIVTTTLDNTATGRRETYDKNDNPLAYVPLDGSKPDSAVVRKAGEGPGKDRSAQLSIDEMYALQGLQPVRDKDDKVIGYKPLETPIKDKKTGQYRMNRTVQDFGWPEPVNNKRWSDILFDTELGHDDINYPPGESPSSSKAKAAAQKKGLRQLGLGAAKHGVRTINPMLGLMLQAADWLFGGTEAGAAEIPGTSPTGDEVPGPLKDILGSSKSPVRPGTTPGTGQESTQWERLKRSARESYEERRQSQGRRAAESTGSGTVPRGTVAEKSMGLLSSGSRTLERLGADLEAEGYGKDSIQQALGPLGARAQETMKQLQSKYGGGATADGKTKETDQERISRLRDFNAKYITSTDPSTGKTYRGNEMSPEMFRAETRARQFAKHRAEGANPMKALALTDRDMAESQALLDWGTGGLKAGHKIGDLFGNSFTVTQEEAEASAKRIAKAKGATAGISTEAGATASGSARITKDAVEQEIQKTKQVTDNVAAQQFFGNIGAGGTEGPGKYTEVERAKIQEMASQTGRSFEQQAKIYDSSGGISYKSLKTSPKGSGGITVPGAGTGGTEVGKYTVDPTQFSPTLMALQQNAGGGNVNSPGSNIPGSLPGSWMAPAGSSARGLALSPWGIKLQEEQYEKEKAAAQDAATKEAGGTGPRMTPEEARAARLREWNKKWQSGGAPPDEGSKKIDPALLAGPRDYDAYDLVGAEEDLAARKDKERRIAINMSMGGPERTREQAEKSVDTAQKLVEQMGGRFSYGSFSGGSEADKIGDSVSQAINSISGGPRKKLETDLGTPTPEGSKTLQEVAAFNLRQSASDKSLGTVIERNQSDDLQKMNKEMSSFDTLSGIQRQPPAVQQIEQKQPAMQNPEPVMRNSMQQQSGGPAATHVTINTPSASLYG